MSRSGSGYFRDRGACARRAAASCLAAVAALLLGQPGASGQPAGPSPVVFEKIVLTEDYLCDGIDAGDFNRDGSQDIVAGPYWYEGPEFKARHEFFPAEKFDKAAGPTNSLFSFVSDFSGDGWHDVLVLGRVHLHQAFWYENPQGKPGPWPKHYVIERVQGETPIFADARGNGRPVLLALHQNQWGLLEPSGEDPRQPWRFQGITEPGDYAQFYHGEGFGDLNGDGRVDLVLNDGWWEQPAEGAGEGLWKAHPHRFSAGKGGAQILIYDVNGDGLNDVITALDAHGWGLAWFEQIRGSSGIEFREHKLMGDRSEESKFGVCFSQPHALALGDIDGDGLQDIVVGKRMWAHGPKGDIEPGAAPVLYWFQLARGPDGKASYQPRLIDDQSGVGLQVTLADVNKDGRLDILTVSKLGAFLFVNRQAGSGGGGGGR